MKLITSRIKSKNIYSGWGIVFNGAGSWSFGNDFFRNDVIFGVDICSSPHTHNRKIDFYCYFLVLVFGATYDINDSVGTADKKLVFPLLKLIQFFFSLHYNGDESYLTVNTTEICKFKTNDKISWFKFCLGSVSKGFKKDGMCDFLLNGTIYDFSVHYSAIEKEDILNIHGYSMKKINIK